MVVRGSNPFYKGRIRWITKEEIEDLVANSSDNMKQNFLIKRYILSIPISQTEKNNWGQKNLWANFWKSKKWCDWSVKKINSRGKGSKQRQWTAKYWERQWGGPPKKPKFLNEKEAPSEPLIKLSCHKWRLIFCDKGKIWKRFEFTETKISIAYVCRRLNWLKPSQATQLKLIFTF